MDGEKTSCSLMVIYNYNPDLTEILKGLNDNYINYAIFVDNSTTSLLQDDPLTKTINSLPSKIIYIKNKGNIGLSMALNLGVKVAREKGCSLVYVLDQDANLERNYFREMYKYYLMLSTSDHNFGILGPIVSNSKYDAGIHIFSSNFSIVSNIINSGMVIPMKVYDKVGPYNENLFLGSIDTEFVERVLMADLKVYRVNKVMIVQDFGMSVEASNTVLKIFNYLTRCYSLILMGLGKTNEYRHHLVNYNDSQFQMNLIDKITYSKRSSIFNVLDKIETFMVHLIHIAIIRYMNDTKQ